MISSSPSRSAHYWPSKGDGSSCVEDEHDPPHSASSPSAIQISDSVQKTTHRTSLSNGVIFQNGNSRCRPSPMAILTAMPR